MTHFALMTDTSTDDLTVLEGDIKSFFAKKFLSLQEATTNTTPVPTEPSDG
jgi:hypothetical protein